MAFVVLVVPLFGVVGRHTGNEAHFVAYGYVFFGRAAFGYDVCVFVFLHYYGIYGSRIDGFLKFIFSVSSGPRLSVAARRVVGVIVEHLVECGNALVGTHLHSRCAIDAVFVAEVFVGFVVGIGAEGSVVGGYA